MINRANFELVGNLGRDPKLVTLKKSQKTCAVFPVAVNIGRKDDQRCHWYDIMIFGKSADYVMENLRKGDQVQVREGIPVPKSYLKDGEVISGITVFSNRIDFTGFRSAKAVAPTEPGAPDGEDDSPVTDDDIPF